MTQEMKQIKDKIKEKLKKIKKKDKGNHQNQESNLTPTSKKSGQIDEKENYQVPQFVIDKINKLNQETSTNDDEIDQTNDQIESQNEIEANQDENEPNTKENEAEKSPKISNTTLLSGATLLNKEPQNFDDFPKSPKQTERNNDDLNTTPVSNKVHPFGDIDDEEIKKMVWQKPATPIVSIMKTKSTPPQDKRSVKFSFSAASDNELNASNFFSNDDSSQSFDNENDNDDDSSFSMNRLEKKSENDSIESIQYSNKIKQKIAQIRKKSQQKKNSQNDSQYDSLIDSYLDFGTNKDTNEKSENTDNDSFLDDNKIQQKLNQIRQSSNFSSIMMTKKKNFLKLN